MRGERLEISVTFASAKGYIASVPELRAPVVALSLGGLRTRIEGAAADPIIVLQLDALTERRALASIDGKMAEFDEGRARNDLGAWLYPPRQSRLLDPASALMDDVLMHERVSVNVCFDRQRNYVASHPELGSITALSLSGLRKQIDERLCDKDVRLLLDKRARLERRPPTWRREPHERHVGAVGGAGVSFRQHRTCLPHWLGQQCADFVAKVPNCPALIFLL
jgi:hypothetical protein